MNVGSVPEEVYELLRAAARLRDPATGEIVIGFHPTPLPASAMEGWEGPKPEGVPIGAAYEALVHGVEESQFRQMEDRYSGALDIMLPKMAANPPKIETAAYADFTALSMQEVLATYETPEEQRDAFLRLNRGDLFYLDLTAEAVPDGAAHEEYTGFRMTFAVRIVRTYRDLFFYHVHKLVEARCELESYGVPLDLVPRYERIPRMYLYLRDSKREHPLRTDAVYVTWGDGSIGIRMDWPRDHGGERIVHWGLEHNPPNTQRKKLQHAEALIRRMSRTSRGRPPGRTKLPNDPSFYIKKYAEYEHETNRVGDPISQLDFAEYLKVHPDTLRDKMSNIGLAYPPSSAT